MVLEPYVTSSFKNHSAMSAAHVVVNITRIIMYPVIAKFSDVSSTPILPDGHAFF